MSSSTSSFRSFAAGFSVAFAILFGASVAGTELMLRRHVLPADTYDAYKERFHHSAATTAAFGDSHVANGLVSTPDFDNFGLAADNWMTVEAKIQHRLRRGGLTRVIVQADPQVFAPYRLKADQGARVAELFEPGAPPLAMLRPQYRQYLMSYWMEIVKDPGLPFRAPAPAAASAPEFSTWSEAERRREASLRVQLHTPVADPAATEAATRLQDTVAALRRASVEVCLAAFPVSTTYREAAAQPAFARSAQFFRDTAAAAGARYVDLSAAFADDRFADPDHLIVGSTAEFQSRLLTECFGAGVAGS